MDSEGKGEMCVLGSVGPSCVGSGSLDGPVRGNKGSGWQREGRGEGRGQAAQFEGSPSLASMVRDASGVLGSPAAVARSGGPDAVSDDALLLISLFPFFTQWRA